MKNKYHFIKIMCVILVVISLVSILVVFNGCSNEAVTSENTKQTNQSEETFVSSTNTSTEVKVGMEEVYNDGQFTYYRDLTTDVMYVSQKTDYGNSLTPMLSPYADGKPLLYGAWLELRERGIR